MIDAETRPSTAPAPRVPGAVLAFGALLLGAGGVFAAARMLHPLVRKWDLEDLAVYRAAGRALLHGHSVFGPYVGEQLRIPLPFIYPPLAAMLAAPFSFLGETPANLAWTAFTIVSLAAVVAVCFAPLLRRFGRAWLPFAFVSTLAAVLALSPVEEHLRFGQVGIPLMACCVLDCMVDRPRWPRGLLVGLATAVKLVPGIFVPYLWLTGRRRAAGVAVATFAGSTLLGFAVAPGDSWSFFTSQMFQPTSPKYFSNQSLEGILQRAIGGPWRLVWIVAIAVVLVYGLRAAVLAHASGDELRAVAITGLVSVLVSPISWIHHLVWVVPVLAAILGAARDRRRAVLAFVVAALFVARLPYYAHDHMTGFPAALIADTDGILCLALLAYLGGAGPVRELRALAARSSLRQRARARVAGATGSTR